MPFFMLLINYYYRFIITNNYSLHREDKFDSKNHLHINKY